MWAVPCNGGKPECDGGKDENPFICSLPEELTALFLVIGYLVLYFSMLFVFVYNVGK